MKHLALLFLLIFSGNSFAKPTTFEIGPQLPEDARYIQARPCKVWTYDGATSRYTCMIQSQTVYLVEAEEYYDKVEELELRLDQLEAELARLKAAGN